LTLEDSPKLAPAAASPLYLRKSYAFPTSFLTLKAAVPPRLQALDSIGFIGKSRRQSRRPADRADTEKRRFSANRRAEPDEDQSFDTDSKASGNSRTATTKLTAR